MMEDNYAQENFLKKWWGWGAEKVFLSLTRSVRVATLVMLHAQGSTKNETDFFEGFMNILKI